MNHRRTYEARKGEVFVAGELVAILNTVDPLAQVKIYSRMNGKPYRVVLEEGPDRSKDRPEAVRYGEELTLPVACETPRGDDGTDVRPVLGAPTALPNGERRGDFVVQGGRWRHVYDADPGRPWDAPGFPNDVDGHSR